MALTAEQQAQVDVQTAIEDHRNLSEAAAENRRIKLEMVGKRNNNYKRRQPACC